MDRRSEVVSLLSTDNLMYGRVRCCSDVRTDKNIGNPNGIIGYYLNFNSNAFLEKNSFELSFLNAHPVSRCLSMDACFLNNEQVMDILKQKQIQEIRIINPGFVVTNDVLSKLPSNVRVVADNMSNNVREKNRVFAQHGLFKYEKDYHDFSETYFVDHTLSDKELEMLIVIINSSYSCCKQLSLRLYSPCDYKKILSKIHSYGLDDDVRISLLGNPLFDDFKDYGNLGSICKNPITIIYDTACNKVCNYTMEPFSTHNMYYSEIDSNGKSSLNSYQKLLLSLEKQEKHIKECGYSPLEAHIYAYRFLQRNYGYDINYRQTDKNNYLVNRQLDMVANNTKAVCAGYATYYSTLMRRCGYPTFRYDADRHVRNIARIKDNKYSIDMIGVIDPTHDSSYYDSKGMFVENEEFEYFMVSPKYMPYCGIGPEFMTVPTAMVIDMPLIEQYFSKSPAQYAHDFDYSALGSAVMVLDAMGFNIIEQCSSVKGLRNYLEKLNRTTIFDDLSLDAFSDAYSTVIRKEKSFGDRHKRYGDLMAGVFSLAMRNGLFDLTRPPRILMNYDSDMNLQYRLDTKGDIVLAGNVRPVSFYAGGVKKDIDISLLEKVDDNFLATDNYTSEFYQDQETMYSRNTDVNIGIDEITDVLKSSLDNISLGDEFPTNSKTLIYSSRASFSHDDGDTLKRFILKK